MKVGKERTVLEGSVTLPSRMCDDANAIGGIPKMEGADRKG